MLSADICNNTLEESAAFGVTAKQQPYQQQPIIATDNTSHYHAIATNCCVQILATQQQLMKTKSDEENKGGGAADARRWNGLRNVVESRALLKTAFRTASTLKGQVGYHTASAVASGWCYR